MDNGRKKLKIVIFVDNFYPTVDGVTKVVETYGRLLSKKGHQVDLFAPDMQGHKIDLPFTVHQCKVTAGKHFGYHAPKKDKQFAREAEAFIKEAKPDIIHIHSPFVVGRLGASLAEKYNIPNIITFHSQYKQDFMRYSKSRAITFFLMKYIMQIFKKVDLAFTMNNACLKVLRSYGYSGECLIVNNGTEFVCPQDIAALNSIADNKYGMAGKKNVMMFAGRLFKQKNIFFIAEVLNILNNRGLDFAFMFVGEGMDRAHLEGLIDKYGLKDKVVFTGQIMDRGELASCYSRAELLLFPSLYDASSLIQIEAAAFYTPAVFINGAVTADTITPDVNGFTAENDAEKYADKVMAVITDKAYLKQIADNAHAQVYKTWENIVDQAEGIYYETVKNYEKKHI